MKALVSTIDIRPHSVRVLLVSHMGHLWTETQRPEASLKTVALDSLFLVSFQEAIEAQECLQLQSQHSSAAQGSPQPHQP